MIFEITTPDEAEGTLQVGDRFFPVRLVPEQADEQPDTKEPT